MLLNPWVTWVTETTVYLSWLITRSFYVGFHLERKNISVYDVNYRKLMVLKLSWLLFYIYFGLICRPGLSFYYRKFSLEAYVRCRMLIWAWTQWAKHFCDCLINRIYHADVVTQLICLSELIWTPKWHTLATDFFTIWLLCFLSLQ